MDAVLAENGCRFNNPTGELLRLFGKCEAWFMLQTIKWNVGPVAGNMAIAGRRQQLIWLALLRASRSIAAGMIALAFPYLVLTRYRCSA